MSHDAIAQMTRAWQADIAELQAKFSASEKRAEEAERLLHDAKIDLETAQVDIQTTEAERDEARAALARVVEALKKAHDRFIEYARQHAAKKTTDGDQKCTVNVEMAAMCSDAIQQSPHPFPFTEETCPGHRRREPEDMRSLRHPHRQSQATRRRCDMSQNDSSDMNSAMEIFAHTPSLCPHGFPRTTNPCLYCLDDAGRIQFTVDPTKHKHEKGRLNMTVTPPMTTAKLARTRSANIEYFKFDGQPSEQWPVWVSSYYSFSAPKTIRDNRIGMIAVATYNTPSGEPEFYCWYTEDEFHRTYETLP